VRDTVFYDGLCGLCHRSVVFLLQRDRDGSRFVFATIYGKTFEELISAQQRQTLPDSIVVLTPEGKLLTRSAALAHLLRRLGGVWGIMSGMIRMVPTRWADGLYDLVASRRQKWFRTPEQTCPVVPEALQERFLP
jgi:predicted DCC family thiol-disulfide oxidoreductase YuxK